jgi:hypothetical protein
MSFNICCGTLGSLAMFTARQWIGRRIAGCFPQCEMSLLARRVT